MEERKFLIFGKFETTLQHEYEQEILGKSSEEIKQIQKRYEVILEQQEEYLMAPIAQYYVESVLRSSKISYESLLKYIANVRKEKYEDIVEPHFALHLHTRKDIYALMDAVVKQAETDYSISRDMQDIFSKARTASAPARVKNRTIEQIESVMDLEEQSLYIEELIAGLKRDEKRSEYVFLKSGIKDVLINDTTRKEIKKLDKEMEQLSEQQKANGTFRYIEHEKIVDERTKLVEEEAKVLGSKRAEARYEEYYKRFEVNGYIANLFGIESPEETLRIINELQRSMTPQQRIAKLNFQCEMYERANEEMGLEVQIDRLDRIFLGKIQGENKAALLFRAGAFSEQSESIDSTAKEKQITAVTHVALGNPKKKKDELEEYITPFISTSMDPLIMATYVLNKKDPLGERASQMVINCEILQEAMKERLYTLRNDPDFLTCEYEFLKELRETFIVKENPIFQEKIEERLRIIQTFPLYIRDSQLPVMTHSMIKHKMIEEDIRAQSAIRDDVEAKIKSGNPEGRYDLSEYGDARLANAEKFGGTSLEVLLKGSIPVIHTNVYGIRRRIVTEISELQSDFIQVLDLSEGGKIKQFIDLEREEEPLVTQTLRRIIKESDEKRHGDGKKKEGKPILTSLETRFGEMYYLQKKSLREIRKELKLDDKEDLEIIAMSEILRKQIVEKISEDPKVRASLVEKGLINEDTKLKDVVPYNVKRSLVEKDGREVHTSYIGKKEEKEGKEEIEIKKVYIITNNKKERSKAEEAARSYIRELEKRENMAIDV